MVRNRFFLPKLNSFTLSSAATSITLTIYLLLNIGLVLLALLSPIFALMGAMAVNLALFLLIQPELALPLYIVVAGPTVVLSVSSSGILSRLYIGNLLFVLIMLVWLLRGTTSEPKGKLVRWEPRVVIPLTCLAFIGLLSIIYSHLAPDPHVSYSFVHSDASIFLVNLVEMSLLIGIPLFTVIVPCMIRTLKDALWMIGAYLGIGLLYGLGTIFAAPLHLYSQDVILGFQRPVVFGEDSSGLGLLNLLFACLAFGQMLHARKRRLRLGLVLLTCIFIAATMLAFGREAWLGLFFAICTILGFRFKSPFVLLLLLMILALLLIFVPGITDFFNPTQVYGIDRINIWQDAIAIWQRSPYIGVGAGNYQFFDLAYGTDIVGVAHNQFLAVLAEMGVQGFLCLLLTIIMVGYVSYKRFNEAISCMGKGIALAFLGYYAALLVATFFTGPFVPSAAAGGGTGPFIGASYNWFFLGLVLSIPNWDHEAAKAELSVKQGEV